MESLISRTGRVQSWMDNPDGRLPVSCTVFNVEDSMEGDNGIEASWRFVSHALRHGAGVAVHLSELRERGHENGKGLTASGPVSFGRIYSTLNATLRRGGVYKNGAVVLHLDLNHPDVNEFITTPREDIPWAKRCVNISQDWWDESSELTKEKLLHGIKAGDIWLNKVKYHEGERVRGNVCLEVYLPSRGTCLLQHVNLGACTLSNIQTAFKEGMNSLCVLHSQTKVGETGEYLPSDTDRQVGLGMLGLANLLRRYGITYKEFGLALQSHNVGMIQDTFAYNLVDQISKGIQEATKIANKFGMVRAFAIAPTASCSYKSKDLDGFTCTPEIAPPIAQTVDRDSGTFGVETYEYGNVQIASEVGFDNYKLVADGIMEMLSKTELLHGYSFNWWSDMVHMDEAFIEEWLDSPQTSLYYSLQVMGDVQDKSNAYAALKESDVEDYLNSILTKEPQCDCAE